MLLLLENPARIAAENEAIQRLAASQVWLTRASWGLTALKDLCLDADISIGEKTYEVRVVYPYLFPDVPATVLPRNGEHWSVHQYGSGGSLCLEYGPDNWSDSITGAALLESAYRLLSAEASSVIKVDVPSRHALTQGQELRHRWSRFVLTNELKASLEKLTPVGRQPLTSRTHFSGSYGVVQINLVEEGVESAISIMEKVDFTLWERPGHAIVDARTALIPANADGATLKSLLSAHDLWPWEADISGTQILLTQAPGASPRVFSVSFSGTGLCVEYSVYEPEQSTERRNPASHDALPSKSVGIVGMGSVGSKIAVSLVRAGVGKFVLVDDGSLAPHNLVRNQLDWREVGLQKVQGVEKVLKLIAPHVDVYSSVVRLAGQESSQATSALLQKIGACDVIVDATANSEVLAILGAVGRRHKKTVVLGEVFAGGYGGMMARSRPGLEASALDVRRSIQAYMDNLEPAPPVVTRDYAIEVNNQVFEASDADVTQLAAAMTQFVLDCLQDQDQTVFPYSAYLMGFRKEWIFNEPFETHPLSVPPAEQVQPTDNAVKFDDPLLKDVLEGVLGGLSANAKPAE